MRPVGVVAAGLVTVEAGGIDSGVAGAFLDAAAEKRRSCLDRHRLEPVTECRYFPNELSRSEAVG